MKLERDLREFIELLNAHEVRYLVVGAHAVAFYGRPRYTADIDLFVDSSPENARRISDTLQEFGLVDIGVTSADFTASDVIVQRGIEPNCVGL